MTCMCLLVMAAPPFVLDAADKDAITDLSNTKFNDYMTRANRAQEEGEEMGQPAHCSCVSLA
jgi:hypothetical protein